VPWREVTTAAAFPLSLILTSLVSNYVAKPNMETAAIGQECVIAVDVYIYAYPSSPSRRATCVNVEVPTERRPGSGIRPFREGQN
jgi:hypothetical protein